MKRHVKAAVLLTGALVVMPCQAIAAEPGPQQISANLPTSPGQAGRWISDGKLMVAVVNEAAADQVRAAGAVPKHVARSQGELDRLFAQVDKIARTQRGLQSWGIDPIANKVVVKARDGYGAFAGLGDGVQVVRVTTDFRQQAGEVNPGDPWWPGGESNCSVGFPATDAQGNKHFLTAGHCTNDPNQAANGASGQSNRIGTSNVGGTRSVNVREGDMGVVAVIETGWSISPNVNTWGQPAVTVTGSADAIVGETVCHSGNTAPNWECGKVTAINQTIDYGNVVIEGLTTTTACSQGGDSGGAWLRGDPIRDFQVTVSRVQSTASGRTVSPVKVTVEGNHSCLEDLNINLVSPSGRWYSLQRYGGATCHPMPAGKTYDVPADETAAGTWTLRIGDNGYADTGTLTNWSITL
ncbi:MULTISPECIES: proprotein convertase P-domain-containing protein [unclassified Kribbella]|uniref:proprotein convertase P-domain-containing protein n=1 Tax=unclassified Kribbella TaxID=2644121 RepID=UPI00301A8765